MVVSVEAEQKLLRAKAEMLPADSKVAMAELAACLTLVAPPSMSAEDRTEWLRVACVTVRHIPASALTSGCEAARRRCRWVSELVPTIIEESKTETRWLRWALDSAQHAVDH